MIDRRLQLARAVLDETVPAFERRELFWKQYGHQHVDPVLLDIRKQHNTVSTYANLDNQSIYLNMYFAKHIACWRWIRQWLKIRLGWPLQGQIPVVSIGAGPWLCLLGWFFDHPPFANQQIFAIDPLDWNGITQTPHYQALLLDIIGRTQSFWTYKNVFFPPGPTPPQLSGIQQLWSLPASWIPAGSIVLLPFVLNHLLGETQRHPDLNAIHTWIESVRQHSIIILVDMPASRAVRFWMRLLPTLGLAIGPIPEFSFNQPLKEVAPAYPNRYSWQSRRVSGHLAHASGLVGTQQGWLFIL